MAAIADNFATEDVLKLTINAGVDMLLLPIIYNTDGYRACVQMVETAVQLAEAGEIDTARIDESVRRILALKKRYGLLDRTDFTVSDDQVQAAVAGVGSAEHRERAFDIAADALTLLGNENGAVPIHPADGETVLVLFADNCASRVATVELAREMLLTQGVIADGAQLVVMVNTETNGDECVKAAEEADYCILVYRTYGPECLDPETEDGFSSAVFEDIIDARHAAGKQAVLITCQLPYDAARFPEADALVLTYNSSIMRTVPPETGTGSAYAPNLLAALVAVFGDGEFTGRLPVNIYALDSEYRITDEVLYPRP